MKARKVGDILPGVMRGLGLEAKLGEATLVREWPAIVGGAVAERSRPVAVRKHILLVEVANNAWMQEIRFHQGKIIERVRELFPELEVDGLRLMLEREREEE